MPLSFVILSYQINRNSQIEKKSYGQGQPVSKIIFRQGLIRFEKHNDVDIVIWRITKFTNLPYLFTIAHINCANHYHRLMISKAQIM